MNTIQKHTAYDAARRMLSSLRAMENPTTEGKRVLRRAFHYRVTPLEKGQQPVAGIDLDSLSLQELEDLFERGPGGFHAECLSCGEQDPEAASFEHNGKLYLCEPCLRYAYRLFHPGPTPALKSQAYLAP